MQGCLKGTRKISVQGTCQDFTGSECKGSLKRTHRIFLHRPCRGSHKAPGPCQRTHSIRPGLLSKNSGYPWTHALCAILERNSQHFWTRIPEGTGKDPTRSLYAQDVFTRTRSARGTHRISAQGSYWSSAQDRANDASVNWLKWTPDRSPCHNESNARANTM